MLNELNSLRLTKLAFEATVRKTILLPGFLGNTLRGAMGNSFVDLYCKNNERANCAACEYTADCVYASMFKSVYRSEEFGSSPNPFVINCDCKGKRQYAKGETILFEIILFGNATRFAKETINAVRPMLRGVFGGETDGLELTKVTNAYTGETVYENNVFICMPEFSVWSDEGAESIEQTSVISIEFLTPAHISRNSRLVPVFDFDTFMDSLFWRIAAVADIYGEKEFVLPYRLIGRKPYIIAEHSLVKKTIPQEKNPITGMIGTVTYSGELTRYMPYIDLGSQLHVGKLTTRGCGQYIYYVIG